MTTSGSTNFAETARQVITSALEMVGVCAIGETPAPEDATKGQQLLNLMLKTWGADPEPKLWQLTEATLTLVASTASYDLKTTPGARKVTEARRRTGSGTSQQDIGLSLYSRSEYLALSDKASTGTPLGVYLDQQRATRTLYVYKVPDATIAASTTIRYTYLRVIEDIDALDDDFDVPAEWFEALEYGLAARLAVPYDLFLTNPSKAAKIEERAGVLYAQLSAYDDEDGSVFMQPAA